MIHGFIVESRFSHPENFLAVRVWFQSLGLVPQRCKRLKTQMEPLEPESLTAGKPSWVESSLCWFMSVPHPTTK